MIYVNFHFMGNILFNFLPSREAIVNKGYKRLLELAIKALNMAREVKGALLAEKRRS